MAAARASPLLWREVSPSLPVLVTLGNHRDQVPKGEGRQHGFPSKDAAENYAHHACSSDRSRAPRHWLDCDS